ncbi:MAG: hypothetical protein EON90_04000 [Brevundimonas sp.]|nr:MAG: hypothetical protein EON90_04000 [Brevundimonas sp.]
MSVALVFAALMAALAPQDPPPSIVDDVVVEGVRRDRAAAYNYIQALTAPPFGSHTMATWETPICLAVENLGAVPAEALKNRVLGRAGSLEIEVGEEGCEPNVIVIFSADGAATATALVEDSPQAFRPTSGATQGDNASLSRFMRSDRPVRWWSVHMPVDVTTGQRVIALGGENTPIVHYQETQVSRGYAAAVDPASRGQTGGPPWRKVRGIQPPGNNIRDAMQATFIVVDAQKAAGASLASVGDYLSMVILTQVDPEADMSGVPSILNLFSNTGSAGELSQWDIDYLRALYATPPAWTHIRFQQQDIARRMAESTSPAATP